MSHVERMRMFGSANWIGSPLETDTQACCTDLNLHSSILRQQSSGVFSTESGVIARILNRHRSREMACQQIHDVVKDCCQLLG